MGPGGVGGERDSEGYLCFLVSGLAAVMLATNFEWKADSTSKTVHGIALWYHMSLNFWTTGLCRCRFQRCRGVAGCENGLLHSPGDALSVKWPAPSMTSACFEGGSMCSEHCRYPMYLNEPSRQHFIWCFLCNCSGTRVAASYACEPLGVVPASVA
jgi:hypothetical protein